MVEGPFNMRISPSPSWGGVRGGGNPCTYWFAAGRSFNLYRSAIPPTLSLPLVGPKARFQRDGGGDDNSQLVFLLR